MSNRCDVTIKDDIVIKKYKSSYSFKTEIECYERLKEKAYIPRLIAKDDIKNSIEIEKIKDITLSEYITRYNKIPYNIAKDFKNILIDMADVGIVDTPDFYKFEHIFISSEDQIKIIDFDVNQVIDLENPNAKVIINIRKKQIDSEYSFLEGNKNSWEEFKKRLYLDGIEDEIIDDFYCNMKK